MKIKRFLALFLSVCLLVSAVPVFAAAAENPFTDVPTNKYYYQPVLWAVENGITTGKTPTTFAPNDPCTRKQIVTFLWRSAGEPAPDSMDNPFTDVKADRFEKAILWAYYEGITTGTTDTTFSGDNTCTRKQIVTFLWRYMGQPQAQSTSNPFVDVKADRFQNAILWAYYAGITTGTGDGSTFSPEDPCTRGQIVTFLYRANGDPATPNPEPPSQPSGSPVLTAEEVYAKCSPAVFYIEVYDAAGNAFATGSGFFIDSNGTAVTNFHVIDGAYSAKIRTSDTGAVYDVVGVFDYSIQEDWAVIYVNGSGFSYLNIGSAHTAVGGAKVFAIGSPLGLENTISEGIISNPSRKVDGVNYIQITAPISHGSSGGALINKYGDVIGITSAGFTDGQNLNLALPISVIDGYQRDFIILMEDLEITTEDPDDEGEVSQNAYTALYNWILNYGTVDDDGDYVYEWIDDYGSYTYFHWLYTSPGAEDITVMSAYFEGDVMITAFMDYTANPQDSVSTYFYEDAYYSDNNAEAAAYIERSALNANYAIPYHSFQGDDYHYYEHMELHLALLLYSLDYTNMVFEEMGSGYTVADLGFTSYN